MFCVKCGKQADVENFCRECFAAKETLFEAKNLKAEYCELCGLDEGKIIEKIEKSIKTPHRMDKKISVRIVGNKAYATITATGRIKSVQKSETKGILVMLRKRMCELHSRLSGGYYEAMMQIRGGEKENILKHALRLLPEKSISSIETLNEGYNIKVMRKANAAAVAKAFRKNFSVKESYKLVGSKKGRMLYRNFYAVR